VLAHLDAYDGAIVLPIDPVRERARIEEFIGRFGRPVVFVDTPLPFLETLPRHVAFVGYDSAAGGEVAAMAAVVELQGRAVTAPRVIVIGAAVQRARQDCFITFLKSRIPDVVIGRHDNAGFDRQFARRLVEQELGHAAKLGHEVHLIFCTNDEMALGARSAVQAVGANTVVIGYDAVPETTALIDGGDSILRNSVLQDRGRLAEETVKRLFDLFDGVSGSVQTSTLLEPQMFRPIAADTPEERPV